MPVVLLLLKKITFQCRVNCKRRSQCILCWSFRLTLETVYETSVYCVCVYCVCVGWILELLLKVVYVHWVYCIVLFMCSIGWSHWSQHTGSWKVCVYSHWLWPPCIADADILFWSCFLWPPCGIGQAVIFLPCGFSYLSSSSSFFLV